MVTGIQIDKISQEIFEKSISNSTSGAGSLNFPSNQMNMMGLQQNQMLQAFQKQSEELLKASMDSCNTPSFQRSMEFPKAQLGQNGQVHQLNTFVQM